MLFVEKWRPKEWEEVVGLPKEVPNLLGNLPNLLFVGKPGTGKTTVAKIIVNKLGADTLTLNASSERGIDVVRDKIQGFAMTQSTNGKHKIIFLDEMDMTTPAFQTAMRNLMETYHKNCRFICTANYENKIIDALKSRLEKIEFKTGNDEEIFNHLKKISKAEKINIKEEVLKELVTRNKNDIRKSINNLQRLSELKREVTLQDLNKDSALPETIHKLLEKADFIKARQTLLDSNIEYDVFLDEYHVYIMDLCLNKKTLSGQKTACLINYLADAMVHINQVISKEIIVEVFILKAIQCLKQ